jgi:hypothetical protein
LIFRPADDPHRLAPPFDGGHLPGIELADVLFHRRTDGLGPFAGLKRRHERHRRQGRANRADHGRRTREESAPSTIYAITAHDLRRLLSWKCRMGCCFQSARELITARNDSTH